MQSVCILKKIIMNNTSLTSCEIIDDEIKDKFYKAIAKDIKDLKVYISIKVN